MADRHPNNILTSLAVFFATGLGTGYLPLMPGTYGSAVGVALYAGLNSLFLRLPHPQASMVVAALAISAISFPIVAEALRKIRGKDPSEVVLDEVAGQLLTLLPVSFEPRPKLSYWLMLTVGFFLFRAFDAIKPYPIWRLEELKGAWGIVADDLAAGVAGAIVLELIIRFF